MNNKFLAAILCIATVTSTAIAQTPVPAAVKPAAAKPAPAKPAPKPSRVDEVIQLVKSRLPESVIISQLKAANKSIALTNEDLIKLNTAGVSENIMNAMMNPAANTAPVAAAATPVSPTPPPPPPPGPEPTPPPVPAVADYNTDFSTTGCVPTPRKRVLAISEFDFGGVKSQIQAIFGTEVDIGKGIMALLTKQLQQDGKYRIVERANLKVLLGEQDTGAGNRVKQGSNPKIGKMIGADAYLMGTIVVFGRDDKNNQKSTAGLIPGAGALGVKWGKKTDKAVLAIAYRLVDTETGEIIDTAQERGESSRESKTFAIAGLGKGGGGGIGTDMTSSNFAETIIGEATIACIKNLSQKMSQQQAKVKMRRIEVEGRLADIAGKNLYITASGNDGVNRCDKFEVSRIVREVKDPVTKETIDLVVDPVGEMLITEVRDKMSVGVYNGSVPPQVNMAVRKVSLPEEAAPAPQQPATTPAPTATAEKK